MAVKTETKRAKKQTAVIPIDWNLVGQSLMAGESGVAIASKIGVHENTLYLRCKEDLKLDFVAFKAQKKAEGDDLIHRTQFEVGIKQKNVSMLIWLGKQRLGQSDKSDVTSKGESFAPKAIELIDSPSQVKRDAGE